MRVFHSLVAMVSKATERAAEAGALMPMSLKLFLSDSVQAGQLSWTEASKRGA